MSYDEMQHARQVLIQQVQQQEFAAEVSALQRGHLVAKSSPLARLTPYLDDEGLLRVQADCNFLHCHLMRSTLFSSPRVILQSC